MYCIKSLTQANLYFYVDVCARTPFVCLKEAGGGGMFVCVVRFVIGCSGPHQSLPELVICMGLIDNRATQGRRKFYSQ